MYQYPNHLRAVSNREDFLLTLQINDDVTGEPINISGVVTQGGLPFTGNNWLIIIGASVVTFTGTLTLPAPPIGGQLLAVTIAFTPGLNIAAGSPIKVTDPAGTNFMLGFVTSYNNNTGALIAQFGMAFDFEIRGGGTRGQGWGYGPWYNTGWIADSGPFIRATLGNGIAITDIGYIQILVPVVTFQQLRPATYLADLIMSDSVSTRQIFAGTLPVIYGGVARSALTSTTPGLVPA